MQNFSLGRQIEHELEEFRTQKVKLARSKKDGTIRYLKKGTDAYDFSQPETIQLLDLYYNSQFEDGPHDSLGQRKIFLNIGKFRALVAAKQINIDTKDFKFLPDDYADPWTSFFMQKDFHEWAKESDWGQLLNECIEKLPRYGTIVLKKVGNTIIFVPLQNIRNEQTAKSLKDASYVIEEHPDMYLWEITAMPKWNTAGLQMRYDERLTVYERYGYVPLSWFKRQKNATAGVGVEAIPIDVGDDMQSVYVMGIAAKTPRIAGDGYHIFYLEQATCPYRETHWDRQHGRWLGIGVMEDLVENQIAKNIVVNLWRRSLHWSSKRVLQSKTTDMVEKNLIRDVSDGEVLEVGANGEISQVDLSAKNAVEMNQFMTTFDQNADQKAFTYDIVTGSLASHTPYRLAIILAQAVASYYALRKENLGLFLKKVLIEFAIPQFLRDLGNEERVVSLFGDEPGFDAVKAAAIQYVKGEAARVALLSGKNVDANLVGQAAASFASLKQMFFKIPKNFYKTAKYKFDLTVTGEEFDVDSKVKSLTALYQAMVQTGDKRAEKVLERILALQGTDIDSFGAPPTATAPVPTEAPEPAPAQAIPGASRIPQNPVQRIGPQGQVIPAQYANPAAPTG